MKASVYHGKGDIRIDNVPDPKIEASTDAVVRITHACICGSDLWFYRGEEPDWQPGFRTGHEWMGIIEDVGADVKTLKKGDRVLAPFAFSDGTCEFCHKGLFTSCLHRGFWGGKNPGGQAEAIRCLQADGTLVKIPDNATNDDALLTRLLPLTDVMGTGHHAAVSALVRAGSVAVVVGDGAVGLCGVLAAKRLGAERIIHVGHNKERLALGKTLGATDIVDTRDDAEAIRLVMEMTGGGAESVLECVGYKESFDVAIGMARPGGTVGFVGVPHVEEAINLDRMFLENVALRGGVAPVRGYIPELMADVLAGKLDPSPVLDLKVSLDEVPEGYAKMDKRKSIKALVRP